MAQKKTILFFPLNSPGHINSSLGIADRIKADYGHRTVFLVLGPQMSSCIQDRGHELVELEEVNVFEDYEVDPSNPDSVIEDDKVAKEKGLVKKKFAGVHKWPQLIQRAQATLQKKPLDAFVESLEFLERVMVTELKENHDNFERSIKSIKPDLIIADTYYIPPCIAALDKVPWVRLFSANPLQLVQSKIPGNIRPPPMCGFPVFTKEQRSKLRAEHPEKWQEILDSWADANRTVAERMAGSTNPLQDLLNRYGLEPPPLGQQTHDSPYLNFYLYPKELDYDQEDDIFEYPARWFRCDSLLRKFIDNEDTKFWSEKLSEAMQNKKAVVFFSFGSIASGNSKLMERYIKILSKDKDRLYVISKGVNGDKYELDASNMIGANYIPQTFFLQRSDLAIVHGGNNSVTECLYYGVPMIILPNFADQLDNAQRVEDLSFGKKLNAFNCSEKELLETIDEVLADSELARKVHDIGLKMRARDDSAKISFMLNKLAQDGKLESEFVESCRDKDFKSIMV